ncbi:MAG TPA: hypothetical protein VGX21_10595 [Methylomirabilota bacterium]|nr:hypothetical protein [Methylomirabilota bacterium]
MVQRGPANHYACPSCHLHLVSWDGPSQTVEIFHKVGLWQEFGTRRVRLICQSCLGATEVIPEALVQLLRERHGLGAVAEPPGPPRPD